MTVLTLMGSVISMSFHRAAVLERADAHIDAIGAARSAERQIATLITTDIHRIAQAIAPIAYPQTQILRGRRLQVRSGTIFLTGYGSLRMHTHNGLVHIASQDDLPRFLRSIDVVSVDTLDSHGVKLGAHLLEERNQASLCHRLAAEGNANS